MHSRPNSRVRWNSCGMNLRGAVSNKATPLWIALGRGDRDRRSAWGDTTRSLLCALIAPRTSPAQVKNCQAAPTLAVALKQPTVQTALVRRSSRSCPTSESRDRTRSHCTITVNGSLLTSNRRSVAASGGGERAVVATKHLLQISEDARYKDVWLRARKRYATRGTLSSPRKADSRCA
jgi:hypothetical protein